MGHLFAKRATYILIFVFMLISGAVQSQTFVDPADGQEGGETILVEREVSTKIPYHKLVKHFAKSFFRIDTEMLLSFGQGKKSDVVRHFSDFKDRMKYRVDLNPDEVEFKFSMNF